METLLEYLSLAGIAGTLAGLVLLVLTLMDMSHITPPLLYAELLLAALTLGLGLLVTAVTAGALLLAERLTAVARDLRNRPG